MVEDKAGRLWMTTTDFQLIRISGNDVKVFSEKDGLPSQGFSCLVPGTGDDMWVCTATGLVHIQGDQVEGARISRGQIVNRPDQWMPCG